MKISVIVIDILIGALSCIYSKESDFDYKWYEHQILHLHSYNDLLHTLSTRFTTSQIWPFYEILLKKNAITSATESFDRMIDCTIETFEIKEKIKQRDQI